MSSNLTLPGIFRRFLLIAVGTSLFLTLNSPRAWSQDAPAADPVAAASSGSDEPTKAPTTLMDMIIGGGIFMVPIGMLSVWAITLSVFLTLQLSRRKYIPNALRATIMEDMSEVKVRSAIETASQDPSFLGRLITVAYMKVDATDTENLGRPGVEDAIADFTVRENLGMMTMIGYLSIIAQGATMLGLFGTVAGMVLAFDSMGLSGGSDPGALAGNISLALITTAGGLVIAIPAIFLFYAFKNRYNRLVSDAQQVVIEGVDEAIKAIKADQMLARVPEGIAGA